MIQGAYFGCVDSVRLHFYYHVDVLRQTEFKSGISAQIKIEIAGIETHTCALVVAGSFRPEEEVNQWSKSYFAFGANCKIECGAIVPGLTLQHTIRWQNCKWLSPFGSAFH